MYVFPASSIIGVYVTLFDYIASSVDLDKYIIQECSGRQGQQFEMIIISWSVQLSTLEFGNNFSNCSFLKYKKFENFVLKGWGGGRPQIESGL